MIEVLKQALEALESMANEGWLLHGPEGMDVTQTKCVKAITSLRQAIKDLESQDGTCQHCAGKGCVACDAREQEPVACKECHLKDTVYDLLGDLKVANLKLSVRSQRTWVGLTDEERRDIYKWGPSPSDAVYITEAKLKEKNA